jgi:hypothetical protein
MIGLSTLLPRVFHRSVLISQTRLTPRACVTDMCGAAHAQVPGRARQTALCGDDEVPAPRRQEAQGDQGHQPGEGNPSCGSSLASWSSFN